MQKILMAAILAVSLIFVNAPQAEAKESYVGKYATGYDVYLLLDSYKFNNVATMDFNCTVKATNGYDVQYIGYHFWTENRVPYYLNSDGYGGRLTDDPSMAVEATIFKFTVAMAMEFLESQR